MVYIDSAKSMLLLDTEGVVHRTVDTNDQPPVLKILDDCFDIMNAPDQFYVKQKDPLSSCGYRIFYVDPKTFTVSMVE